MLKILPSLDSEELAKARQRELKISEDFAAYLGKTALEVSQQGYYFVGKDKRVDIGPAVEAARKAKVSIPPDAPLPPGSGTVFPETRVQVSNETTLGAARRLADQGLKVLALNFANGIHPGGGFLNGARAQEETLCRSSALYLTLKGDPMYQAHKSRPEPDSTDWAILSPDVPVFRTEDGTALERPWLLSFITCAAPVADRIGLSRSAELLRKRIYRVLAIARAYGYPALVLGAWGCGAFKNDPERTARDFRQALETEFDGAFSDVVFAVTDWSPNRAKLGAFRDVFK